MRVLVVDDEPEICEQIALTLRQERYTVETAEEGEAALEKVLTDPYDLMILDIMLPGRDGFSILQEIRREEVKIPVLLLTAKGEIENRVKGLDLGADDYLHKPFSMAELLARIRALLRRSHDQINPQLQLGPIRLDTNTREVWLQEELVCLTPKEFNMLEFLLYNRNRAVSRFNMAEHVWGDAFDPFTMSNNIDVHIKNLRRKLDDQAGQWITTVRGVGYMAKDEEQ